MSAFVPVLNIFAATASEEAEGIAALGIDALQILAQAGTFLVLFFVLQKYALPGIVKTLEQRRQTIDDGVRLGLLMEKEKAKLDEKVDQALHEARKEADKIIAAGHAEAREMLKAADEQAQVKAEAVMVEARAKIDEDIKRARAALEKDVLTLVSEATEAIIGEKLDAQKDAILIRRALSEAKQ